jgi:predicted alpha/beta superfamily hydrolase
MNKDMCLFLFVLFTSLLFSSSNQSNDVKANKSPCSVNESLEGNYSAAMAETLEKTSQEETVYPRVEIKDTEVRSLKSKYVDQEYKINIFFPKDYKKETSRYPVVYVLDAEYNFGCVAYIARRLIKNKDIPKVLLAGIAYDTTYEDFYDKRSRDLTPFSKIHGYKTGGAESFTSFIQTELIPFIDKNYRTIPGERTIVGHSFGGLYCSYVLFQHPNLFNRYIIVSPSLWYSNKVVFEYEEKFAIEHKDLPASIYLAAGEDESSRVRDTTQMLGNRLKERGYPNLHLKASIVEGENHRSLFPYAFTRGIRFVFAAKENIKD